jgi:hypothetical protein
LVLEWRLTGVFCLDDTLLSLLDVELEADVVEDGLSAPIMSPAVLLSSSLNDFVLVGPEPGGDSSEAGVEKRKKKSLCELNGR